MTIKQLLKMSFQSLKHHKGRSLLTILGIIVGIASIIASLAIGYGAAEKQKQKILAMGNNFVIVWAGKMGEEGATTLTQRKAPILLTNKDVQLFKEQIPEIYKITPCMFSRNIVSYEGKNVLVEVNAGNEDYLTIIDRKIKIGSNFTPQHLQKNSRVIILGSKTAEELFRSSNPIGKVVKIRNIFFTVIGVINKIELSFDFRDPNLVTYIPITTAKKILLQDNSSTIHAVSIYAKNLQDVSSIIKKIRKNLRYRHRLEANEPDDFTILDQEGMMKAAQTASDILNLVLLIIASISLLVGGIGVMNIMLVSVSERTKEIGIRMAVGATGKMILRQFVAEAITLCTIGGIIGIIIGIIVPFVASAFTGWPVIIKISTIFVAFFVTFVVGLIFGYYPAFKASRLDVVEALQET